MFSLPNRCENCWPVQLSTGLYGYWKYDGTAAAARKDGESNTFRPAHTVPQLEPSLLWASLTRVYPICCPRRFAARREWRVFAWRRPVAAGVVSERLHRNVVKCSWHIIHQLHQAYWNLTYEPAVAFHYILLMLWKILFLSIQMFFYLTLNFQQQNM